MEGGNDVSWEACINTISGEDESLYSDVASCRSREAYPGDDSGGASKSMRLPNYMRQYVGNVAQGAEKQSNLFFSGK